MNRRRRYGTIVATVLLIGLLLVSQSSAAIFSYGSGGPGTGLVGTSVDADALGWGGAGSQQAFNNVSLIRDASVPPPYYVYATAHGGIRGNLYGGVSSPAHVFGGLSVWGQDMTYEVVLPGTVFYSSARLLSGYWDGANHWGGWTISVLPESGETLGAPTTVTINATISGTAYFGGGAWTHATWLVDTDHGNVISGEVWDAASFGEANSLQFTIPLGSSFLMDVDVFGETAGVARTTAELQISTFDVSLYADVQEGPIPEPAAVVVWSVLCALGVAVAWRRTRAAR